MRKDIFFKIFNSLIHKEDDKNLILGYSNNRNKHEIDC